MLRNIVLTPGSLISNPFKNKLHHFKNGNIKIYVVSDLHTHHTSNWNRIKELQKDLSKNKNNDIIDIIIIAGDISADLQRLKDTLECISSVFEYVIFVPGNNEFRLRKSDNCSNSLEKLELIFNICDEIGVHSPKNGSFRLPIPSNSSHEYKNLIIHPLLSWYHPSFENIKLSNEKELDDLGTEYQGGWLDFRKIKWPQPYNYRNINKYFLEENIKYNNNNESLIPNENDFVISISHFIPRNELVPKISRWIRPTLMYVVGCPLLEQQIREIQSDIHICGHTHVDFDTIIQNIRYIQHAGGHPNERGQWWKSGEPYKPKLISIL